MTKRSVSALVLTANSACSIRSARPKPIQMLCGRAMTSYVLDAVASAGIEQVTVVTGQDGLRVSKRLLEDPPPVPVRFLEQQADLGSADAALVAVSEMDDSDEDAAVVVLHGDIPLLGSKVLTDLVAAHFDSGNACTILTTAFDRATLLGERQEMTFELVERDERERVSGIRPVGGVGDPLRSDELGQYSGADVALGVYVFKAALMSAVLRRCLAESLSARVPISEAVGVLAESGHSCEVFSVADPTELKAVTSRFDLAVAEGQLRARINRYWMSIGVNMIDPDHTYIDATVKLAPDVTIFPDSILQANTVIGQGCELGPGVRLESCRVGANTRIEKTTASLAIIGSGCKVGPFAYLSPGAELADDYETGPFYNTSAESEGLD